MFVLGTAIQLCYRADGGFLLVGFSQYLQDFVFNPAVSPGVETALKTWPKCPNRRRSYWFGPKTGIQLKRARTGDALGLHTIYDGVQRDAGTHRGGALGIVGEIVTADVHRLALRR